MIRIAIVLVLLVVVGLGALLALLPRLAQSPAVRERIESAARENLGREVSYTDLSFGLLPPRLVVSDPKVAGETPEAPALLEAKDVSLRLALAPLFARAIVVESLSVQGASVYLVRTRDGIQLPQPEPKSEPAESEPAPEPEASDGPGLSLAFNKLALRDATLVLEDRAVSPAVSWKLEDLQIAASAQSLDDPIDFSLDTRLASGGSLALKGNARLEGMVVEATADLDALALAPLAPYLGDSGKLVGTANGSVSARGPLASLEKVGAELSLTGADLVVADVGIRGAVDVKADLQGGKALQGSFEADATQAEIHYGGIQAKPAGKLGTVKGRLVPRPGGGFDFDDVTAKFHKAQIRLNVKMDKRIKVRAAIDPVDLQGWEEIVPALAEYALQGTVVPGQLDIITDPLEVKGRIDLDAVQAQLPGAGVVTVHGTAFGVGKALQLQGFKLGAAGQTVALDGTVSPLVGSRRFRGQARVDRAEINDLLTTFSSVQDTVFGPLSMQADVSGPIDNLVPSLRGKLSFDLRPGRIVGVSMLERTIKKMGTFGQFALLFDAIQGGKYLDRFYEDEFQSLSATWEISNGVARTNDLKLVYKHYTADLWGETNLLNKKIYFTGVITIDEEIDAVIAGAADKTATGKRGVSKKIRLTEVTGTWDDPDPQLSPADVAQMAGSYYASKVTGKYKEKLREKAGEELGGAAGEILDDTTEKIFEGIFGGGRR